MYHSAIKGMLFSKSKSMDTFRTKLNGTPSGERERRLLGANINKDCGEIATERDVQITDPRLSRGACVMVEGCSCGRCHIYLFGG